MLIKEFAQELGIAEGVILDKLKSLKLKAKEGAITKGVAIVLKDEFVRQGIVTVKEEKPKTTKKKATKKVAKKATKKVAKKTTKKTTVKKEEKEEAPKKKVVKKKAVTKSKASEEVVADTKAEEAPAAEPTKKKRIVVKKTVKKRVKKSSEPVVNIKPLPKKRSRADEADKQGKKGKKGDQVVEEQAQQEPKEIPVEDLRELEVEIPISVKDLALKMDKKTNVILSKLMQKGIFANINQSLPEEVVNDVALEFGFIISKAKTQEEQIIEFHDEEKDDEKDLELRAPVITFMGHVDHGKTSLLDRIRESKVADREHGGITQHIAAYSVPLDKKRKITFLDTPGHAAFTSMRSRGADITDIVVLVVAADEGVKPQTEEAIDHARAANVPIVVAINKIDRPNADIDRVKRELMEKDLSPEEWGGKTIMVGVSATTGEGIDDLLEMIMLESEVLDLKANPKRMASGVVVEAHLHPGKGAMATMIVQRGTLRLGDFVVVGNHYCKLKALFNDHKQPIKEAGPSTPVEVLGLPEAPQAGEKFYVAEEKKAKDIAFARQERMRDQKMKETSKVSLDDLYDQIQQGDVKTLNLIVKSDVQGSLEAVKQSLEKLAVDHKEISIKFVHAGVGEINSSDVILGYASAAIILGFNVGTDANAKKELDEHPVDIRNYKIIYDLVDDVKKALEGLLDPTINRQFLARVQVKQVFKLSKSGIVAGCMVEKGTVKSKSKADVIRDGETIYSGQIKSLKRFKDDVKEVKEGMECGITLDSDKIKEGDIIEVFELESIARTL